MVDVILIRTGKIIGFLEGRGAQALDDISKALNLSRQHVYNTIVAHPELFMEEDTDKYSLRRSSTARHYI